MPLDPAFVSDCPYGEGALLIDELLEVVRADGIVRARMPTSEDLPLTRDQRAHPLRHPRHVSGGLMIHATGVMGFVHAYYVLDLRHADGWIGYGTHIHQGRFRKLGEIGVPMVLECRSTQVRRVFGNLYIRYALRFTQGEELIYEGDQSAVWRRVQAEAKAG